MDPLLKALVEMPSVCTDYPAAQRIISYAEQQLQALGMQVIRYEERKFPALVATTQASREPKVMLYAHLDTVDAPADLFTLRLENGKYYGRGVLDMKSAFANYLHVLREIPNLKQYDIGVMLTTDEEYYGNFGTGMLMKRGYRAGVCILPDSGFGSNWQIETFAKGCWFGRVTALGVNAHGSKPWEGSSATLHLVRALDAIARLFDGRQRWDTATLNVGMMQGGTSINQIPASASATLDIRYMDMTDFRKLYRTIVAICDQYDVNIKTIRKATSPLQTELDHPLIAAFTQQVATQTNVTPQPFTAYGTTDARFFMEHGIPCILMSPPGGEAHGDDEWLDKVGYEQYAIILRNYLDLVAKVTPTSGTETPTEALTLVR